MKKIYTIGFILLVCFNTLGQIALVDSTLEFITPATIHGHFYNYSDTLPNNYTGQIEIIDSINSELIKITKEYIDGKRVKVTGWYDNGQIYRKANFKNTKQHGLDTRWYKNGIKEFQYYYEEGRAVMSDISWYEDGSIKSYADEINNDTRMWYKNGNLKYLSKRVDTTRYKVRYYYDTDGTLKTDTNAVVFYECRFFEDGGKKSEGIFNGGKQQYTIYYPSGKMLMQGYLFNSHFGLVGHWQEWYETSQKKREYFYNDTIANLPEGVWSWWDEAGNLIKQEFYENGELKDTKEYLPGKIKNE